MVPARPVRTLAAVLAAGFLLSACGPEPSETVAGGRTLAHRPAPSSSPAPVVVRPLKARVRPDVLVVSTKPMPAATVAALKRLSPGGFTAFRAGRLKVNNAVLGAVGVDPSTFRSFAPQGTAEADAVWQAVAAGELVLAHDVAGQRKWTLGTPSKVAGSRVATSLRLGALATTQLPDVSAVVSDAVAASLGLQPSTGVLLTSGSRDPASLARAARAVVGRGGSIHLLTQPATPFAFLTGSKAAKAFGAFSYRYYDDGTIEPDRRWVAANIVSATVPILGRVTCHRLMVPQLRAALAEVQAAGLAGLVHSYDGCYVPRFIERDPSHPVSLHTWGIAIDLDASSNQRGGRGTMDPRIVAVFKRWGFRWGGDWAYTDPMHFEIGALVRQ